MYDLVFIGGGPAGITAAAMALNQRLETLIIAQRWGGQTTYAMHLEDLEGRETLSGETLLDASRRQLDYLDFECHFDAVTKLMPEGRQFVVNTAEGNCFEGCTLIIATGAKPAPLKIPGEARLTGRGLNYSGATHASLFLGKDVAVVGRERRAQWAVADPARKAHRVYLLAPGPLSDTPVLGKLHRMGNVEILEDVVVKEVSDEAYFEGVVITLRDGNGRKLAVKGVFVELPRTPNSSLLQEWVNCDRGGHIIVDMNCATNWPGVFAAGDVTHVSEQVLVHIGEGAKAAISAQHYLLMH